MALCGMVNLGDIGRGKCRATWKDDAAPLLQQSKVMDGFQPVARAGRISRPTLLKALSITGQNNSAMASVVIEPTSPFDQNTPTLPPEPIIESRNASSARLLILVLSMRTVYFAAAIGLSRPALRPMIESVVCSTPRLVSWPRSNGGVGRHRIGLLNGEGAHVDMDAAHHCERSSRVKRCATRANRPLA
jgi:hypothetical protein